jgi:hypothetical protein
MSQYMSANLAKLELRLSRFEGRNGGVAAVAW